MRQAESKKSVVSYIGNTKTNKQLNELLKVYAVKKSDFESAKAEADKASKEIKELVEHVNGQQETSNFTFNITIKEGNKTINKSKLEELYPEVFQDPRVWSIGEGSIQLSRVTRKI